MKQVVFLMGFFFLTANVYAAEIKLTSRAFAEGRLIPQKYTCEGLNISPPLAWTSGPSRTQSFVIIMEDPDAPAGTWVHWVLFDLPPTIHNLPEGIPALRKLANAEKHGMNSFKKLGYGGPCPPSGTHRYIFKIYALDEMLKLEPGLAKEELFWAMDGHILAEGQLTGKYKKQL